jgi:group I intron endonuclease
MGWIYEISNIENGKIYIGQTTQHNVATRWSEHLKLSSDTHLVRAFRSHGIDKFNFKIICEIQNELLDGREIEEIEKRNCLSPNGYNIRSGGSRGKHSQESIEKIRVSHMGKRHTDETKDKLRQINMGKTLEPETKEKIRVRILGTKRTEEEIEKSAKSRTGLKRTDEFREKMRHAQQIEVEQWSLEGKYIKTFKSIKIAREATGCNDISKCCKGKYKQSKGFIWKYKDANCSGSNEEGDNTSCSS